MRVAVLEAGGGERRERSGWPGHDVHGAATDETPGSAPIEGPVQVREARRLPAWVWMAGVVGCGAVCLAIAASLMIRVRPGGSPAAVAEAKHASPRGARVPAQSRTASAERDP